VLGCVPIADIADSSQVAQEGVVERKAWAHSRRGRKVSQGACTAVILYASIGGGMACRRQISQSDAPLPIICRSGRLPAHTSTRPFA